MMPWLRSGARPNPPVFSPCRNVVTGRKAFVAPLNVAVGCAQALLMG
jgi:hypothetical protein